MKNMLFFILLTMLSMSIQAQMSTNTPSQSKANLDAPDRIKEVQNKTIENAVKDNNERPRKPSYRQIKELAQGVLLVRLHQNKKKIKRLLDLGYKKAAQKAADEINLENDKIRASFEKYFDFCHVYFFDSKYTEDVKKGDYTHLTNHKGEFTSKINRPKYIYFAEMSKIKMDTNYNTRYKSMVIMDTQLNQLSYPFPFAKMFNFFKTNRYQKKGIFIDEIIKGLNEDLKAFYSDHV